MIEPVKEDNSCASFADDLPGLVDHSLPEVREGDVLAHLVGCLRCQEELEQLHQVRGLLAAVRPSQASAELSKRLMSIAGEDAAQPLWLRTGEATVLPSTRQNRRRVVQKVAVSGAVLLVAVLGLALFVAPEFPRITDPVERARHDFSAAMKSAGMDKPVAALLSAEDRGIELRSETRAEARPPLTSTPVGLSRSAGMSLLSALRQPASILPGRQRVVVLTEQDEYLVGDVQVVAQPGGGHSMTVVNSSGQEHLNGQAGTITVIPAEPGESRTRFFRYPADGTQIAGQDVMMLEARTDNIVNARWWFTEQNHLLWSERYSDDGTVEQSAGYLNIEPTPDRMDTYFLAASTPQPTPNSRPDRRDECPRWNKCPTTLGGLPLVSSTVSGTADAPAHHLVYSDGITLLSVTRQVGWLAPDNVPMRQHRGQGRPLVWSWQTGSTVMTIATNGSSTVAERARTELAAEPAASPDLFWRLQAGLRRMTGSTER